MMKDGLIKNNIPFGQDMFVPELYKLVQLDKYNFTRHGLDKTVRKEGDILRLPPYHPDLNPIELMWPKVKDFVPKRNSSCNIAQTQACKSNKNSAS